MKRLYVLRHSKAGQTNKKILNDQERPLTQKGLDICPNVAEYLQNCDIQPELVICSTALRTKQTVEEVLEYLKSDATVEYTQKLYLASSENIFTVIQNISPDVKSVMIAGHNPGLHQFVIELSGKGAKKKFREMRSNFPPASIASFNLNSSEWVDCEIQSGELMDFASSKELKKKALELAS